MCHALVELCRVEVSLCGTFCVCFSVNCSRSTNAGKNIIIFVEENIKDAIKTEIHNKTCVMNSFWRVWKVEFTAWFVNFIIIKVQVCQFTVNLT